MSLLPCGSIPGPGEGLSMAVDARTYANEARFVRRSCQANAEVGVWQLFILDVEQKNNNSSYWWSNLDRDHDITIMISQI